MEIDLDIRSFEMKPILFHYHKKDNLHSILVSKKFLEVDLGWIRVDLHPSVFVIVPPILDWILAFVQQVGLPCKQNPILV